MISDLDNMQWPSSPLKAKKLDAEQIKQFLLIRAAYEKSAFVTEGHLEIRQLGAKEFTRSIPPGECAITALVHHPNGHIYGGTSGEKAHLFYYNPAPDGDACADIGALEENGTVSAMRILPDLKILASVNKKDGTSALYCYSPCEIVLRDEDFKGRNVREIFDLPAEDQLFFSTIDPCHSSGTLKQIPNPVPEEIADFVLLGSTVFALGAKSSKIYCFREGDTLASCPGRLDVNGNFSGKLVAGDDCVYAAGLYGRIFRCTEERITPLSVCAPSLKGRELYNKVTAWTRTKEGMFYGGTVDGILFSFDPAEEKVLTYGKATDQCYTCALAVSSGKIYGLVGMPEDCCHLTVFDPSDRQLRDLGCLLARSERPWNGYRFGAMVKGNNGTLYLGEMDRMSHLFMYYPAVE